MAGRGRGRGRGRGGAMPDVIANTLRELGRTSIGDKVCACVPPCTTCKLNRFVCAFVCVPPEWRCSAFVPSHEAASI